MEYTGTVILVSHDRAFLDNVAGSTLAYMGDGEFREFVGGYSDYLLQAARIEEPPPVEVTTTKAAAKPSAKAAKRLSYKEKQELEALPQKIEDLETEQATLTDVLADPATYRESSNIVASTKTRLEEITAKLATTFDRWAELDERSDES